MQIFRPSGYGGLRGKPEGIQGATRGYKGLEGDGGERKIWKRICQKSTYSNQVLCQFKKKKK